MGHAAADGGSDVASIVNSALALRLASFLGAASVLRLAEGPPAGPPLAAERVAAMFMALRDSLSSARQSGSFVNVWQVAGLKRSEVRNAAVLAWLLDPRGSHGFQDRFARALFALVRSAPPWLRTAELGSMLVSTEERPVGSDENRVDISVRGSGFLLFVEVKIDAPEGQAQLARYRRELTLKQRALGIGQGAIIFLTLRGDLPRHAEDVAGLAWRDVAQAASSLANGLERHDPRRHLLFQFTEHASGF